MDLHTSSSGDKPEEDNKDTADSSAFGTFAFSNPWGSTPAEEPPAQNSW